MAAIADNPSDRERSAGGLVDHFQKNLNHHHESLPNDGYHVLSRFNVGPHTPGVYRGPQLRQDSAELLNAMLEKNEVENHVYFSETGGFHNHGVHHLLAAYALGAAPTDLQLAHDTMASAQRPRYPIDEMRIKEMLETKGFQSMLGDDRHFHDYLAFFLQKFEKEGWKAVLTEYLSSGTALADNLLARLFAGIWHNFILLGYGIEFEQAGIVAEGLAGACVHSDVFEPYLLECERLASASNKPCKALVELLKEIRDDAAVLCDKEHWGGGNSFAYEDSVASNAPPGMAALASQWTVKSSQDLRYRTVELLNVNAFVAGAAQRHNKAVKIDFIFVHHVNASIFFSSIVEQEWIQSAVQARLLEWYTRMNLLFYAANLGPELLASEIIDYKPVQPASTWSSIIQRGLALPDDGHLVKLIRALAHGEQVSRPWEQDHERSETPLLPVKGGMWLQIANMGIDSAEAERSMIKRWVRGAGSDEAWAEVPDRRIDV